MKWSFTFHNKKNTTWSVILKVYLPNVQWPKVWLPNIHLPNVPLPKYRWAEVIIDTVHGYSRSADVLPRFYKDHSPIVIITFKKKNPSKCNKMNLRKLDNPAKISIRSMTNTSNKSYNNIWLAVEFRLGDLLVKNGINYVSKSSLKNILTEFSGGKYWED